MASYYITLEDSSVTCVADADAYQQEGPLTTFFRTRNSSMVINSWSERLASFRTASLVSIQRLDEVDEELIRVIEAA